MAAARCIRLGLVSLGSLVIQGLCDDKMAAPIRQLQQVIHVTWSIPKRRLTAGAADGSPEEFVAQFDTNGKHFEVQCVKNHALLPSSARHDLMDKSGHFVGQGPMPNPCFYIGSVVGDENSTVGLSTCGGGLSGIVVAHGHAIAITPESTSNADIQDTGGGRHLASKIVDDIFTDYTQDVAQFARGLGLSAKVKVRHRGRRLAGAAKKYVEVFLVNDKRRFEAFGGQAGLQELAQHSVSVMNSVTAYYRNPPGNGAAWPYEIQVVLVGQQTFLDGDPWEQEVEWTTPDQETDSSSLLDHFNTWGQVQLTAGNTPAYDNRVLLSGRDFDGNTIGLAGVSTMCYTPRSGNVNMCGRGAAALPMCSAVVAHEMGHNFGMHHDSSNNACSQSGNIMQAVTDGSEVTQFSDCSITYIVDYFANSYSGNGGCLENFPTRVEGDPICGNGFVEVGEDCDCGGSDCSTKDPCCNGNTCSFADAAYECSGAAGPCCEQCMFVMAGAAQVCRGATSSCDLPEHCPGGTAECAKDLHMYPGKECMVDGFMGLCSAGKCGSLSHTCSGEINRDFAGNWDLTETCAAMNDDCQQLVCHNASEVLDYKCGQAFSTHGKQMTVPDGSPCWFPGHSRGQRTGMCYGGKCSLPHQVAVVPLCGNGGIDFGEECDCGAAEQSTCCECDTCRLKAGTQCSEDEPCCDGATCQLAPQGTTCRSAVGECDAPEVCSGTSAQCPRDDGKRWGESCTSFDGVPSTCFGKLCLVSMDSQCLAKHGAEKPFGYMSPDRKPSDFNRCTALACCGTCEVLQGTYTIDGETYQDPYYCNSCTRVTSSSTFTAGDVSTTIYIGGAVDGQVLDDPTQMCIGNELVVPNSTCSEGSYLEESIGRCVACDSSCFGGCSGPTQFDCTGGCMYGGDTRGACAISMEQYEFANRTTEPTTLTETTTPAPEPEVTTTTTTWSSTTKSQTGTQTWSSTTKSQTGTHTWSTTTTSQTGTAPQGDGDGGGGSCDNLMADFKFKGCDVFIFQTSQCGGAVLPGVKDTCGSNCKVLAGAMSGKTCSSYCQASGVNCKDAWENVDETCEERERWGCDTVVDGTDDVICECEGFTAQGANAWMQGRENEAAACLEIFDLTCSCSETDCQWICQDPPTGSMALSLHVRERLAAAIRGKSCISIPSAVARKIKAASCASAGEAKP